MRALTKIGAKRPCMQPLVAGAGLKLMASAAADGYQAALAV